MWVSPFITEVDAQYEKSQDGFVICHLTCGKPVLELVGAGLHAPPLGHPFNQAFKILGIFKVGVFFGNAEELGGKAVNVFCELG
ncbi:hypothetical protein IE4771_CH03038 [Rhizobium etli bv. mimosae str. IE4771]|uniref:Uncharacterized protein n=1 Tax=Rhizobium etli bv. mimosae str. IE4771 TaxID=1432050 RepID=A0A060I2V8_RHIET|nr:hypothetical protein IE4771_CH03038 [Rhizobium sp. IE4771]